MSAADFLGVIADFNTGTYTVTRQAEGEWVLGRWEAGDGTPLSIDASVQPMTGELAEELPEGIDISDTRVIYTGSQLFPPKDPESADGAGADRIDIDGQVFRIYKVEHFKVISNHYRALAIAESPEAPPP